MGIPENNNNNMLDEQPIEMKLCPDCKRKFKGYIKCIQDSLDYLRVTVKYLIFDLEVTQREKACLKKLLEDKNS